MSKPCYRYRITEGSLSKRTSLATVDSAFKSLSEIQRIAHSEGSSIRFDAHIVRLYLYIYTLLIDCPASKEKVSYVIRYEKGTRDLFEKFFSASLLI